METSIAQVPKVWGIRRKDFELLSYSCLESIFYGIHNIEISLDMLNIENPDEIIAKIFGAGNLKRYNRNMHSIPTEFISLCKLLDRTANQQIGYMASQCRKRFPSKPGDQEKRLLTLSNCVKNIFTESFFKPYIPSQRQEPNNPDAFHDPNIDGRDRTIYINKIYRYLQERYEKNLSIA